MRVVIQAGHIELHFASPHDMAHEVTPCLHGEGLPVPGSPAVALGRRYDVVVYIPWLGRRIQLTGEVETGPAAEGSQSPGLLLRLADGPHDTLAHLAEVTGKVVSGALLEPEEGETNPEKRILSMAPSLRALLAPRANPAERLVLARDPDPRVVEMLLKNPSIALDEVRRLAARATLTPAHFQQIVRHPSWMADETLRLTLARNPRLPEFLAETVLPLLTLPALKSLAESPNVTAATRRVAVRVLASRGIVISARRGF